MCEEFVGKPSDRPDTAFAKGRLYFCTLGRHYGNAPSGWGEF